MISEVFEFNATVIKPDRSPVPRPLIAQPREHLITCLLEEVEEFQDAGIREDQVDALLDLCYFAIGGLYRIGLTPQEAQACFDAIHEANMTKVRGVKKERPGTEKTGDAVKPKGWKDPKQAIAQILSGVGE